MKGHTPSIRKFDTGATRNAEEGKLDFEGFLSPLVLERYAKYMDSHRRLPDGSLRDSDNWQRGIPLSVYMKSAWRHFFDLWREHRGIATPDGLENDACALLFNISGYLHEHLKANTSRQLYDEADIIAAAQDAALDAITAESADLAREVLTAEELKGFGIGDVAPRPVAETATTVATSRHPMAAEALRDEYEKTDGETGV